MVVYSYYLELKDEEDSVAASQGDEKYFYTENPA